LTNTQAVTKIGPADHSRRLSCEAVFPAADKAAR
jgi:hypothetical protein